MTFRRVFLACTAPVALLTLLSGCVAAVAIPLLAGSALKVRDNVRVRAATRVSEPKSRTRHGRKPPSVTVAPNGTVVTTTLRELPPPSGGGGASDPAVIEKWRPFIDYALAQAKDSATAAPRESALLATGETLSSPKRVPCTAPHPAVVIDLDDNGMQFVPDKAVTIPPDVAAEVESLRRAGIVVLWISQLPSTRAADVARALKNSGLDPQGQDQMLLIRGPDDRKQVLRLQANADVCIVAIAGDRRGDFDELFDYLRNPAGAVGLYPMMRRGWFLVPAPFGSSEPEPE